MLNKYQKQYLKKIAHGQRAIFQIGKDGISKNLCDGLNQALNAHELIKISILKTCPQERKEVANQLSELLDCEIVNSIGRVFVLYRKSKENKFGF